MKRAYILTVLVLAALPTCACAYELETIRKDIVSIDKSYEKALGSDNLVLFHESEARVKRLIEELDRIVGGTPFEHPAGSCRFAAYALQNARGLEWVTRHSRTATEADKRINQANLKDYRERLKECTESARH